jgi:protein-L-isoaspartate(D-aspartate) O-methyltransferase
MESLDASRRSYARMIVGKAGVADERLVAAFAAVERERFIGPGPWSVPINEGSYARTDTSDPRAVYQDIVVALAADRGINNGQPSLHAKCLALVDPKPGERVVHVGAGTGYYTALLATLVGPSGPVAAYEIEPDLAERARENLRAFGNVRVHCASATEAPLPQASDVIYVSAGATHPVAAWLDALAPGGRLLFPFTPDDGWGCMLAITRRPGGGYAARAIAHVGFIDCIGARDAAASAALTAALRRGNSAGIRSLHRNASPDRTVWCAGRDWWLSTADWRPARLLR